MTNLKMCEGYKGDRHIRAKNKALFSKPPLLSASGRSFSVWHYEMWRHSERTAELQADDTGTVVDRQQPNSRAVPLHYEHFFCIDYMVLITNLMH